MATTLAQALRPVRARRDLPPPDERRRIRERAGLSQAATADVLGVSRPTLSKYEHGKRVPEGEIAVRYLRLLRRLQGEVDR